MLLNPGKRSTAKCQLVLYRKPLSDDHFSPNQYPYTTSSHPVPLLPCLLVLLLPCPSVLLTTYHPVLMPPCHPVLPPCHLVLLPPCPHVLLTPYSLVTMAPGPQNTHSEALVVLHILLLLLLLLLLHIIIKMLSSKTFLTNSRELVKLFLPHLLHQPRPILLQPLPHLIPPLPLLLQPPSLLLLPLLLLPPVSSHLSLSPSTHLLPLIQQKKVFIYNQECIKLLSSSSSYLILSIFTRDHAAYDYFLSLN